MVEGLLKMAKVKDGHLFMRTKNHEETHVKIVSLGELAKREGERQRTGN